MVLVVGMAAAAAAAAAGLSVGKPCHLAPLCCEREALCMRMRINSREREPASAQLEAPSIRDHYMHFSSPKNARLREATPSGIPNGI